jgi:hypothetical protein
MYWTMKQQLVHHAITGQSAREVGRYMKKIVRISVNVNNNNLYLAKVYTSLSFSGINWQKLARRIFWLKACHTKRLGALQY